MQQPCLRPWAAWSWSLSCKPQVSAAEAEHLTRGPVEKCVADEEDPGSEGEDCGNTRRRCKDHAGYSSPTLHSLPETESTHEVYAVSSMDSLPSLGGEDEASAAPVDAYSRIRRASAPQVLQRPCSSAYDSDDNNDSVSAEIMRRYAPLADRSDRKGQVLWDFDGRPRAPQAEESPEDILLKQQCQALNQRYEDGSDVTMSSLPSVSGSDETRSNPSTKPDSRQNSLQKVDKVKSLPVLDDDEITENEGPMMVKHCASLKSTETGGTNFYGRVASLRSTESTNSTSLYGRVASLRSEESTISKMYGHIASLRSEESTITMTKQESVKKASSWPIRRPARSSDTAPGVMGIYSESDTPAYTRGTPDLSSSAMSSEASDGQDDDGAGLTVAMAAWKKRKEQRKATGSARRTYGVWLREQHEQMTPSPTRMTPNFPPRVPMGRAK